MKIPKDLAEKRYTLAKPRGYAFIFDEGFNAGVEAAFESECVKALVKLIEGSCDCYGGSEVEPSETCHYCEALEQWEKRNE